MVRLSVSRGAERPADDPPLAATRSVRPLSLSLSLALRRPLRRSKLTSPHRTLADVLKSRIQNAEQPPRGANYIINTFKQIYRQEGARAFIAGLTPTCASSLTRSRYRSSTDELSPLQICERACAPPRRASSTTR